LLQIVKGIQQYKPLRICKKKLLWKDKGNRKNNRYIFKQFLTKGNTIQSNIMVNTKMKKRAVSPVIATVLLIALVTAAAAIVFLVVIPMLNPAPTALLTVTPNSTDAGSGNRAIQVDVKALNGALNITGVDVTGVTGVTLLDSPTGSSVIYSIITQDGSMTIYIVGAFSVATEYSITISFESGVSSIAQSFTHTA
jgi:FlaG/FlaF family flagellin (archaellin)